MRIVLSVLSAAVLFLVLGCGSSPTAPAQSGSPTGPVQTLNLGGAWTGTSADRMGSATLTLALTQTGGTIAGTAVMKAIDDPTAERNACAACHKNKPGTVSGTLSGTSVALSMFFPSGDAADITPACSFTIDGASLSATESQVTGTYSGGDSCEGTFADGALRLAR